MKTPKPTPARPVRRALRAGLAVAAVGLVSVASAGADDEGTVRYANPQNVNGSGDCRKPRSTCSLPEALAAAQPGDTVELGPGAYHVSAPLTASPGITVQGDPARPRPRLIAGASLTGAVLSLSGGATVRHLAISTAASPADALRLDGLGEDLLLASGDGAAAVLTGSSQGTVLRDAVAVASGAGNAVAIADGTTAGPVDLRNVTAIARGGTAVLSSLANATPTIKNVVARGTADDLDATGGALVAWASNFRPASSVGVTAAGGDQSADPRFADPANGDFHPLAGSPLIDAGVVDALVGAVDPDGLSRTLGGAPNIGAYEAVVTPLTSGSGGTTGTVPGAADPVVELPHAARPRPGKSLNVKPTAGRVLVRLPGTTTFVPVRAAAGLPVGATVDTRSGAVQVASARDGSGTPQTGVFSGGLFQVRQSTKTSMVTVLALRGGSFADCPSPHATATAAGAAGARKASSTVVRQLWGHDHGGRFRTDGRYASALVRGTIWLTQDRCDGTLVRVKKGAVAVHDPVHHRTVLVRAGHHVLIRRR